MTLSTNIYILDPVDPHEVFNFINENLLKVENPRTKEGPSEWYDDKEVIHLVNEVGQGFDAWLMTQYRAGDKPLYAEDQYDDYSSEGEEPDLHLVTPACYMSIDFDTAYGYQSPVGGCADLHSLYIVALHDWLAEKGVRIKWQNEFTGEYFDGLDGLEDFGHSGEDAREWFHSILPGVLAHLSDPSKPSES